MYTIKELSQMIHAGDILPTDLVRSMFQKIRAGRSEEHIFITTTEELAMEQAEQAEASIRQGRSRGMLTGIPFTLKDVFHTKGILTTGGSQVLNDHVPPANAEVVDTLYEQGAVLLGKVNLHEFAYGATGYNPTYGTVCNPYNKERLAGGSSSGSAAAVAKGYGLFSLGTDTGGSSRVPAALCGISGFKPTRGLISCKGVIPLSWTLDHVGILAGTPEDIRIIMEQTGLLRPVEEQPLTGFQGMRIGIPDSFFYEDLEPDIEAVMDTVKERFREMRAELVPVHLPDLTDSRTASLVIQLPEILSYHGGTLKEKCSLFAEDMQAGMAAGQFILAEHYILAKRTMNYYGAAVDDVFRGIDLMLLPSTPCVAPRTGEAFVKLGGKQVPAGNAVTRFFSLFNMTGNPSLTVPAGFSKEGLPIGFQLVGRVSEDRKVLRAAEAYCVNSELIRLE